MPRILHPLVITMAVLAAGACSQLKPAPATLGHLDARTAHGARQAPPAAEPIVRGDHSPRPPETPAPARAATAATAPHAPATPAPPQPQRAYSLDVHDIAVAELLLAMGRDAGLDLDLHPGIEGRITLRAQDQPLRELLERIARQADIRYELRGRHLVVRPDSAEIRAYALDYVNLSREMRGTVATSTQIATTGSAGQNAANGGGSGNASVTQIETRASNDFWAALEANLVNILADSGPGARRCGGDTAASACHSPNVMINRESGVLMVRATARQHEHLRTFLGSVQQAARRQVMIEATIVEVTLADGYRQGIDWTRLGVPGWNIRPRGSGDARPGAPTVSYLSNSTDVRLELLETFGTVKVLSSPRLSVLNNQTAMLKVVEEVVYFLVDSTTTEYDDRKQARITATTTPQSVSVGMVMSVTPQISAEGEITLNVRPTISGISGFKDDPNPSLGNIPNRVPQIRTREIESMLRLRSGEVGVLGGLMEDRIDHDTGRIPLLGDLPVVGELFTRRDNAVRRTELLIFLRPLLIDEPTLQAGYASYATHLPDDAFLTSGPSPGQRNFPHMPLRPLLLPAGALPASPPDIPHDMPLSAPLSSTEHLP